MRIKVQQTLNEPGNAVLLGILAVALALRLWGIGFGLPFKYHIDEPPYVIAALRIASGNLYIKYPYNSPNLFQFILAIEYAALYAIGRLVGVFHSPSDVANLYQVDPSVFYLLARGTSSVLGTATVGLTYALGKAVYNRRAGLLAALILAVAFIHVRASHYAVTDTLVTLLILTCVLCSMNYLKGGRRWHLVLSGLASGAAVGFKYLPAPVLVAPVLAILLQLQTRARNKHWQAAVRQFSLLTITVVAGFLLAFPALLISRDLFHLHLSQAADQAATPLAGLLVDTVPAWLYYMRVLNWGLGLPLMATSLAGLLLAAYRRRHGDLLLLCSVIMYYTGISLVRSYFARYALSLIPVLMILVAEFLIVAGEVMSTRSGLRWRPALLSAVTLLLLAYPLATVVRHNYLLTQLDTRTIAKQWIEKHIPSGSKLAVEWHGPPIATALDPEPYSQHIYDVFKIDPFAQNSALYSLEYYRDNGFDYLIVNSFTYNLRWINTEVTRRRSAFYSSLDEKLPLLQTFQPNEKVDLPFIFDDIYSPVVGLWQRERPGPTIKVYKVQ